MHQIYDTVAKSGRNDLFESRLRLKTIGSASSYRVLIVVNSITRLNLKAVLEVYVTHYHPPPSPWKNPPKKQDLYFVYFLQETDCEYGAAMN